MRSDALGDRRKKAAGLTPGGWKVRKGKGLMPDQWAPDARNVVRRMVSSR
jgi:hypothetical protein